MSFHTAFKDCYSTYVEVFRNPTKREATSLASWKECGAIRVYITPEGELFVWDAHSLHTDTHLFDVNKVVPVVISKGLVYVTDGIRFLGGRERRSAFVAAVRKVSANLKEILGTYKVQVYGDKTE